MNLQVPNLLLNLRMSSGLTLVTS